MKLYEVLKAMENELPLTIEQVDYTPEQLEMDCIPSSNLKVTICFMCEEETWVTAPVNSPILIPWYDCEVSAFNPSYDNHYELEIWLKHRTYIVERYKDKINYIPGINSQE